MSIQATPEQIQKIGQLLRDKTQPIAKRHRAIFTLRNIGGEVAIQELVQGENSIIPFFIFSALCCCVLFLV
jgi:hypothetical protein